MIKSTQEKLAHRVATERQNCTSQEKLEPAAHLDPGPKGHDMYGAVGHSLFVVPKAYIDEDLMIGRSLGGKLKPGEGSERDKKVFECQEELVQCRVLLQRYVAGVKRPELIHGGGALFEVKSEGGEVGVSVLLKPHLNSIMAAYEKVIKKLQLCEERGLQCQAINELGDIMILSGNIR